MEKTYIKIIFVAILSDNIPDLLNFKKNQKKISKKYNFYCYLYLLLNRNCYIMIIHISYPISKILIFLIFEWKTQNV